MRRKPMPLYSRFDNYNNYNEHEYDPYIITNGKLQIDETWWKSLTLSTQNIIKSKVSYELVDQINVPHTLCSPDPALTVVYWAYIESFDYQCWYSPNLPNGPKNVILVKLDQLTKENLLAKKGGSVQHLKQELETICFGGIEYFVRLSGTSGKNEKSIRSFKKAEDIIKHLMDVEQFQTREYKRDKDTYLVLIPWNENIDPRCEFRIFVVEGKITAASPQKFWELQQYSSEELEAFQTAFDNIEFIGKVPYSTFVADVYIDIKTSICHLIELNPFGAHSGAGSSFFNWIDDFNILYGLVPAEIRYLSAINY